MKNIKYYLTFFVLIILITIVIRGYAKDKKERLEIESIVSNALKFYSKEQRENLKIDSYLMLREITKHTDTGHLLIEESKYDEDLFIGFLNKEKFPEALISKMPDLYPPYRVNLKDEYALKEPFAGVLLKALYCDELGYDDSDFRILKTLYNGDGSYWDTHFLLSLLFLKSNGCYSSIEIEESIKQVSLKIIEIQKKDTVFTDIYAERIAMLYWAGYGKEVKKEWIDIVKDNFMPSYPGWEAAPFLDFSNAHTNGLAILSLLYYLEGKPYQSFY